MDVGFSCRKNAFFQAPIKLAQPFPAPELRTNNQRRRNDNINKICVLEGVGEGENYGKLPPNAIFPGKFHDNKI